MYIIAADDQLIHAPHLLNEGCGVISPKLTVELNKAGSLDYTMPPNHIMYNKISKLKTIITVYNDDKELFRGRVLHDEKDFYNQKQVYCEGELAFLLDSIQRPYSVNCTNRDLFKRYVNNHNSSVESTKRFVVGNITAGNSTKKYAYSNTAYTNTMDEMNEHIVNGYGGYLKVRPSGDTRYLDWLEESGKHSSQVIQFGINLLDITEHITAEDVFTVLIPTGGDLKDEDGNDLGKCTIKDVNDGKDYVENTEAIALFGRIERQVDWSDITTPSELKALAEEFLKNNIEMAVTITLKAVDLHLVDVNAEEIYLGDYVWVVSTPHSIKREFQCTKIVYDLTNPDQTEYTFGVNFTSLTDKQVSKEKNVQSAINNANAAAKNAETIIAQIPTGVISDESIDNIWNAQFNK